jgi:hypothetical protein
MTRVVHRSIALRVTSIRVLAVVFRITSIEDIDIWIMDSRIMLDVQSPVFASEVAS